MHVENALLPSDAQMAELMRPGPDGPIYMLNMLKFREEAVYEDGRVTDLTGEEAYAIYWDLVAGILRRIGGGAMFNAPVTWLMMGQVDDVWDRVGVAMYPSRGSIVEMIQSEEHLEIAIHRNAGLAGQLNLELAFPAGVWLDA